MGLLLLALRERSQLQLEEVITSVLGVDFLGFYPQFNGFKKNNFIV